MAENNKEKFKPSVYSNYGYANPDGIEYCSRLGFMYWNDLLRISIHEKVGTDNGFNKYADDKSATKIFVPYIKAQMLLKAIELVESGEVKSSGVDVSNGYIGVSKTDLGIYLLTILIFKDKNIVENAVYEFKSNHYYLINNIKTDGDSMVNHTKQYLPTFELDCFKTILTQFANAMTYAYAYSVTNVLQYDARLNTLFGIAGKLGVGQFNNYSGGKTKASDVFASEADDTPIDTGSIEDLY